MHSFPALSRISVFVLFVSMMNANNVNAEHAVSDRNLSNSLTLSNVYEVVLENDFTLMRSDIIAKSLSSEAESKDALPDPVFFASMQNLPTDTFDLDQEAMTQLRVGVRQMFPKGDSLSLSKHIVLADQSMEGFKKHQRRLKLRQQTEKTWLEAWYWQTFKRVIEHDRVFLTQMQDFIQSVYQLGGNNQSDFIGAKLELIKLDEKILEADRHYEIFRHALNTLANKTFLEQGLSSELISLPHYELPTKDMLFKLLSLHPDIQLLELTIQKTNDQLSLVHQDSKPQWGLELSYGLRQGNNLNGSSRPDLLSAGVSVALPLFSGYQKSQSENALRYKQDAFENKRTERLHNIIFELENLAQQYRNTQSQIQLYQQEILPTLTKQKSSALQSYEADKGDFRVVTDLYLKEQATKVKLQRLGVNSQLVLSQMNYWLSIDAFETQLTKITSGSIAADSMENRK